MKKLYKHLLILAVFICCIAGIAVNAQAAEVIDSGTCGSNLRWSLDDTGTLTISGTGAMVNYTSASNVPWYTYRKSISSIIISDGITSIGDSAFEQCSSRSITIPKSVTSIGAWAFSESSLQSITIPDGVTSIGMHAFARCPYLKSINIPNGVTKISNCAFYKSGIQSITIPNSVTSIGVFAFSESSLTSIIIPNSVTNIDGTAFFNCCCLRKVTYCGTEEQWRQINLNSGNAPLTAATRIYHNWNISSCTELKSCTICGESTIGHAWLGATCDKPETCSLCGVTEGDICHNVILGICKNCQQYGTCGKNLIWTLNAVGTLTILGTGEMTDYGWIDEAEDWIESPWQAVATDIKAVVIEKGVTTIGCEAFYNLSNLTSVTIGDSVTSIGSHAFYDCANLTSITIGNSVSSIGGSAFNGCSSLTSITIPDSVTSIGEDAFSSCSSLNSITIPDSVTSINYGTFQSCSSLTSVTIPDSVTIIDDSAFRNCSKLTSVTIPDNITSIEWGAFLGCSSLTSITIPSSVISIGDSAFRHCSSLTSVTILEGVTYIGDGAFYNCNSLTSITIPDSVTSINASAFSGCSSLVYNTYNNGLYLGNNTNPYIALLKSISLSTTSCEIHPDTKVIASEAFYGCTGLTSITIPNSIANIGSNAFYDCSNLRSITLGDNVTIIGDSAFSGCSRLTSITIPDSVTSIGFQAFYDCSSLAGVYITDMTVWYNIEFHGYWANPLFYAKNLYLNGELVTDLLIPDCVTYIGEYAFFNCSSITNITIGNSVTTIGWGAFEGCSNLASITIPDSVTSIGWYAFNGCSSLNHVAYTGTESQWNSISIGADNTNLKNASRHYETRFKNVDTCLEHSVYCPVCEEYLVYEQYEGAEHSYGDWVVTTPPTVTTEGEKEKICSVCGDRVTEIIPNTGGFIATGTCGDNLTWTLDDEGTLTISGTGSMDNYFLPEDDIPSDELWSIFTRNASAQSVSETPPWFDITEQIENVIISDGVTSIGDYAFKGCSRLTSINIPDSVTYIGLDAFKYCSSLTSVTIGNSVTSIGAAAFRDCSNLISITIPDSVTSIGDYAFLGCSSLSHVAYTGTENQWNSISIDSYNIKLKSATRHYETRFLNVDNCIGKGVYCPVCEEYLVYEAYENSKHCYGDWVITTPPTVTTEGEKEKVCSVCGDRVTETIPMLACGVSQWGVTLADDIGATFYLKVENDDLDNTFVTVTVDGVQKQYNLRDLETANGQYILHANVAAAQMYDNIIIQVRNDNTTILEKRYTIRQYAEYILDGNYPEETKYLVQAMLNYGASTQKFFNYNTTNLANSGYELTDVPEIPEASTNSASIGKINGISYYGASLNHEAKISVRFYFTVTGNIKDYTFTDAQGNTYRAMPKNGMYYIEVLNINPADYDQVIKIIVHDGSNVMMVDYSPLRYICRMFHMSDDVNLVNMVAALYRYHKAAETFLDSL